MMRMKRARTGTAVRPTSESKLDSQKSLFGRVIDILIPKSEENEDLGNVYNGSMHRPEFILPRVPHIDPRMKLPTFLKLNNFASAEIGAHIIFATDEYNCSAANILEPHGEAKKALPIVYGSGRPQMHEGNMWITRRRRVVGHDWCIVKLPTPIIIRGLKISTEGCPTFPAQVTVEGGLDLQDCEAELRRKLTSDFPEYIHRAADQKMFSVGSRGLSVEIQQAAGSIADAWVVWHDVLSLTKLKGNAVNYYEVEPSEDENAPDMKVDVIRLNMMPDGCLSNFEIFGEVPLNIGSYWRLRESESADTMLDYAAAELGGQIIFASSGWDSASCLTKPGHPKTSEDVWITPRQVFRGPLIQRAVDGTDGIAVKGAESAVVALAARCVVSGVECNTFGIHSDLPYKLEIFALDCSQLRRLPMRQQMALFENHVHALDWERLGGVEDLEADEEYYMRIGSPVAATHIMISLIPDGALARLRVRGNFVELSSENPLIIRELDTRHVD